MSLSKERPTKLTPSLNLKDRPMSGPFKIYTFVIRGTPFSKKHFAVSVFYQIGHTQPQVPFWLVLSGCLGLEFLQWLSSQTRDQKAPLTSLIR
jgi:hypothetical protein